MGYLKINTDLVRFDSTKQKRLIQKLELTFKDAIFPVPPFSLKLTMLASLVLYVARMEPIYGSVHTIRHSTTDFVLGDNVVSTLVTLLLTTLLAWFVFVQLVRLTVRVLLYYQGWMYEPLGKPSLPTKLWMMIIALIAKYGKPGFFSYQQLLPPLPLPALETTVEAYLKSVRPLLTDEEFAAMSEKANEYCKGVGKQMQWKLWLKWLTSSNYMTDWWKELVYMRQRESLIKSTVCGGENFFFIPTHIQAARAANVAMCCIQWARDLHTKQSTKPITMGGIPLCQQQYADVHRSIRLPGKETDIMMKLPEKGKHMAVWCKGCWYKVPIYVGKRLARAAEFQAAFQSIIDRKPDSQPGEYYLASLTAGSRVRWAEVRARHFASGVNKASLSVIEHAHDVMFLDHEERHWQLTDTSTAQIEDEYGRTLHAYGYRAWFDKPTTLFISKNGRYTSQGEHSVADAMIYGHMREFTKYHENYTYGYTAEGNVKGEAEGTITPERLEWNFSEECRQKIDESYAEAKAIADDYGVAFLVWPEFGKNVAKKAKLSPDAFCQMAIQLSFYRDQGKFELTYEPTMTRLFKEGRTETVRSCSTLSCDWVLSMENPDATREERLQKLRLACDYHQNLYRDAMSGKGVDRHLFAHRVITRYLGVSAPFIDAVFDMPYVLSTSQVPQHQQTDLMKTLNAKDELYFPAGMFTCPDHSKYGVCYSMRASGDLFSFSITSHYSNEATDCHRFKEILQKSLMDMKNLVSKQE